MSNVAILILAVIAALAALFFIAVRRSLPNPVLATDGFDEFKKLDWQNETGGLSAGDEKRYLTLKERYKATPR